MFAKHPLDKIPERIARENAVDALRLAIIAELDAISFYTQIARAVGDEGLRRLFLDVAREEKTHVGEFMEALRRLDPEQASELEKGAREAIELLGGRESSGGDRGSNSVEGDPSSPEGLEEIVSKVFREALSRSRILRSKLPVSVLGPRMDAVIVYVASDGGFSEELRRLDTIAVDFAIPERLADRIIAGDTSELAPIAEGAQRMAIAEEEYILGGLRGAKGLIEVEMGDWSQPGRALDDVSKAYTAILRATRAKKYLLVVSPKRFSMLLAFHERSGVMELERIKRLVGEVVVHPLLGDDEAYLIPVDETVLDIAVGQDATVEYIGQERGGEHVFRARETMTLRLRRPNAIARLRQA
ncbi:MAG: family 1 encapsulin nanocompartment shell protein [Pyrodictiaceae archaeon]